MTVAASRAPALVCAFVAITSCGNDSQIAYQDAPASSGALMLDCAGPPAHPAGQLGFSTCQVATSNGDPSVLCDRDQTGAGTGALTLVLLDAPSIAVGTAVALDSSAVTISGAFTTSAITASSVDGMATGSVTFTVLQLTAPMRMAGTFSADATMKFRPDPPYTCALRGSFEATGP